MAQPPGLFQRGRRHLSHKMVGANHRRSCTKFTEDQLKILINTFNQKPYPGYATKQKLALEINTEESRIQIWFQNQRARFRFQKRPGPETLESSQSHGQDQPDMEFQSREARRCRTIYSPSQLRTLIEAFMKNPYPGIDYREQLAKEIGVPESRVQIWFQNRRSRLHLQRKRKLVSLEPEDQGKISEGLQGAEDTQNGTNFPSDSHSSRARTW
ncbi:double homeobox protein A-like [Aotus nancymaae]|uniref:double homeobox protein A-like n=1 Tax=Aotus nancymaae TaxID=37293 RepID=UPI000626CD87|nr:double homeobox protein A-like [Aotus nancymaae]